MPIIVATVLSRPLGYVRVVIQAWLFGATSAMDAFVLAFSVPSMLQVVLLTGPLSGVLVPTLTAYKHDRQALNKLFNSLFTFCLRPVCSSPVLPPGVLLGSCAWLAPVLPLIHTNWQPCSFGLCSPCWSYKRCCRFAKAP